VTRSVEAGVHRRGQYRRVLDRVLPVHELIVVQAGTLPVTDANVPYAVRAGHWLLLEAGNRHHGHADIAPDMWFYWVCFRDADLDLLRPALQHGTRNGRLARPNRVRQLFEHLLADQQANVLTAEAARCYVQLILTETTIEPATPAEALTAGARLARQAAAQIKDRFGDPELSTARIADDLACHPDHLGRVFRATFDETLTGYLHRVRIDRTRQLFRTTDLSIGRVANDVGFSDMRYFRRIFTRYTGLTPSQFRQLHPQASDGA
jgi:AraC-like DNA-binding protein